MGRSHEARAPPDLRLAAACRRATLRLGVHREDRDAMGATSAPVEARRFVRLTA